MRDERRVAGGDVERADEREGQRRLGELDDARQRERLGEPHVAEADRRQEREAPHEVGPLGHRRGDGAAERVADERRPLQAHPPEGRRDVVGVGADPGPRGRVRAAEAGEVDRDARPPRVGGEPGPPGRVVEEAVEQDQRPSAARPRPDPQPAPVRQRHVPHQVLELLQGDVECARRCGGAPGPTNDRARLRRSRARVARSRWAAVAGADGLSSRAFRNFARSSSVILRTDREPSSICSCMRSSFACRQASSRSRCVFGGMSPRIPASRAREARRPSGAGDPAPSCGSMSRL